MGGSDIFIHQKQIGELQPGSMVSFAVVLSPDNKPQAYDVLSTASTASLIEASLPPIAVPPTASLAAQQANGGCNGGGNGNLDEREIGKFIGTVKSFNTQSGYGFIFCQDLSRYGYSADVFLHQSNLGGFQVGGTVHFTAIANSNGQLQAKNLSA